MKDYLSVKEFSELTGISVNALYRLVEKNEIKHYRIGRTIRFKEEDYKRGKANEEEMVSGRNWT